MDWLREDHRLIGLAALVVILLVLAWLWWRGRRKPTTYASSYVTDEMNWLWQQLQILEPGTQLGGIYADKPGYHNCRKQLPSSDYSVCDRPPDDGGPSDKAAAIDWTFPEAQRGDYGRISVYTKRLIDSGKDPADPRMNGWRECYGNADNDTYVEGWDFRYGYAVTSDSSHLWHIHLSESRSQTTSKANKEAVLSVLKGESLEAWLGLGEVEGDGAVLLNCPYDSTRQDLFYVAPNGNVIHRWGKGLNDLWAGKGSSENLGGTLAPGTLTAMWKNDESGLYIAGLGQGDANAPAGAGMYWGMELQRGGSRSGWGSFEKCYGGYPSALPTVASAENQANKYWPILVLAVIADLVAVVALLGWILR